MAVTSMSVVDCLRKLGAHSPLTAVTTARVVREIADPERLVYRELERDPSVCRAELEGGDDGPVMNGWYVPPRADLARRNDPCSRPF